MYDATLTPERHKDCKEDGCFVVEEVHDLGVSANFVEAPEIAEVITSGTNHDVICITDVLANEPRCKQNEITNYEQFTQSIDLIMKGQIKRRRFSVLIVCF